MIGDNESGGSSTSIATDRSGLDGSPKSVKDSAKSTQSCSPSLDRFPTTPRSLSPRRTRLCGRSHFQMLQLLSRTVFIVESSPSSKGRTRRSRRPSSSLRRHAPVSVSGTAISRHTRTYAMGARPLAGRLQSPPTVVSPASLLTPEACRHSSGLLTRELDLSDSWGAPSPCSRRLRVIRWLRSNSIVVRVVVIETEPVRVV